VARQYCGERGKQDNCQVAVSLSVPADAWQNITWREGSNTPLTSRFARRRVRPAPQAAQDDEPAAEEWLLIEWPADEPAPTKYWLFTLPDDVSFERLVDLTKLRWRIERDYLELKQEIGLDHYEGRGWRGFHHHASLCIAAYGFLISETETLPPPQEVPEPGAARDLPFPPMTDPEALPLRTQRHMPNSIATLRLRLARALVRRLHRCPCCGQMRPARDVRNE
jgi:SRSO17 transposase